MSSPVLTPSTPIPFLKSIYFIKSIGRAFTFKHFSFGSELLALNDENIAANEDYENHDDEAPVDGSLQETPEQRSPSGSEDTPETRVSPEIVDEVAGAAGVIPTSGDEANEGREPEEHEDNPVDTSIVNRAYDLPTFDEREFKEPFTSNKVVMDDMFDAVLIMKTFWNMIPSVNVEEPERVTTTTSDTNGRDTASPSTSPPRETDTNPISEAGTEPTVPEDDVIEVFPARKKALQFLYLRFLVNAGIYDLPPFDFTVEDADRLFTCGMIGLEHLDHVFTSSMMGHGVVRRILSTHGFAQVDGTVGPPCEPWTIPIGTCVPTEEEVFEFIANCERLRFDRRYACLGYRLAAFERPVMSEDYVAHRLDRDGLWGLKRMAKLGDEEVEELLCIKDLAYVPPETYLAGRCAVLESAEIDWEEAEPKLFRVEVDFDVEDNEPEFFEPVEPQRDTPDAASSEPSEDPTLISSSSPSSTTSGHTLCSVYKGKKRARSPSPTSASDTRRVRPCIASQEPEPSTSVGTEATQSKPVHASELDLEVPRETSTKCKKRGREEEDKRQALADPSPAKKTKITESAEASDPHEPGVPVDPAPAQESDATTAEPSLSSSSELIFPDPLPAGSVARCKSRRERPPTRPTRDPTKVYDAYYHRHFNKPPDGRKLRAEDADITVRPDCEKGPKYAVLYDLIQPSWAELCARWKLSSPARELGHGTQPEPGVVYPTNTPTHVVPPHRRLRRMPMQYLYEAYPHIHPRVYEKHLTQQNARCLNEVYPELFPPIGSSGTPSERDSSPDDAIVGEPDGAVESGDSKINRE